MCIVYAMGIWYFLHKITRTFIMYISHTYCALCFFFISNSEHLNTHYMMVIFTLVQLLHFCHTWQYFLHYFLLRWNRNKSLTKIMLVTITPNQNSIHASYRLAYLQQLMKRAQCQLRKLRCDCIASHGVASNHHYLDIIQLGIHGMSKMNSSLLQTLFVHFDILANWNECV